MEMADGKVRYHYRFTGRVQGVGFRWRARTLAEALGLTGWVENMWDGSVEMELQGYEVNLDRVIEAIQTGHYISIDRIERKKIPTEEQEYGFHVR
ncbi:MAG: acylphosphatase [Lachnospiraceae bacterium]|nr:acylphosphatase [Lachnospiraceae bacterium]